MASNFIVGTAARLEVTFRDSTGAKVNPDDVTLKIMAPDGTVDERTYTGGGVLRDATGEYSRLHTFNAEGTWHYRWEGAGAVTAATEGRIEVTRSVFV